MTVSWSAPGRVNLIGEHVDYNDGPVLPFALPMTTTARVTANHSGVVTVTSDDRRDPVTFPVEVQPGDVTGWSAYVAGVVWSLNQTIQPAGDTPRRSGGIPGLDVQIRSDVPIGAGLSSSAALECSVASAVNADLQLGLDPLAIAALSRRAENDFVGVPTGVMDQLASMFCAAGHVLLLDCRTLDMRAVPFDPVAAGLAVLVINTHAEHELADSEYGDRRQACEAAASRLQLRSLRDATLAEIASLPDPVLRRRAHHVVTEIARVQDVVAILDAGRARDIGGHLTASHESLRDDFEVSCDELDVTVDAALAAGALGARMTGGGFGGCAIVLCRRDDVDAVEASVHSAYERRGWRSPTIWPTVPARGAVRVRSSDHDRS